MEDKEARKKKEKIFECLQLDHSWFLYPFTSFVCYHASRFDLETWSKGQGFSKPGLASLNSVYLTPRAMLHPSVLTVFHLNSKSKWKWCWFGLLCWFFSLWFACVLFGVFFHEKVLSRSLSSSSDMSTILSLFYTRNKLNLQLNFYVRIHRLCSQVTEYMIIKCRFNHWMLFCACFFVYVQRDLQMNRPEQHLL